MLLKLIRYILIAAIICVSFLSALVSLQAQTDGEGLKISALSHMEAGRFGEAIDLLNKYISANPRQAEGYHLRAQCFEQRSQYQESVLDYRRARRLAPDNQKIIADLNRTIEIWHALLYRKIEGHQREIAINPNNSFNYLEIGKSYRWLEIWHLAEEWYDEYLARDNNASPDEIIRYTEILAKTGSIKKGERILKIYVQRYPSDWRLWSRYGYFTLWLSKYRTAKNAFETALSYKPFFKEAQDGLDLANRQGYIRQYRPRAFEKVYLIDEYFRRLKRDPLNHEIRFKLVDELIKKKRFEEASQQMAILARDHFGSEQYYYYAAVLDSISTNLYESQVEEYSALLKLDPSNKKAVIDLANAYGRLYAYDEAIEILEEYLAYVPEDRELDVRFLYTKYAAWNYEWEKSLEQLNKLLEMEPDNLDYQLLSGQISVWTVQDMDQGQMYLENVLDKRPKDINAMLSLVTLHAWIKDFPTAKKYLDKAKEIDSLNSEVEMAESNYHLHLLAYEELQILKIRGEAGKLAIGGNCEEALIKYDEYLSKITGPNRQELREYADINACVGNYDKSTEIYNSLLEEEYDFNIAVGRAKNLFLSGDSLSAKQEFSNLVLEDPSNFDARLFLADIYGLIGEVDSAREHYNILLDMPIDSSQTAMVKFHRSWLPVYGLEGFLESFPSNISLNPSGIFYSDNTNLRLSRIGSRLDIGITQFISLGATFIKTYMSSDLGNRTFTSIRGNLSLRFSTNLTAGLGFGSATSMGLDAERDFEAFLRFDRQDTLSVSASYNSTDAALLLYSSELLDTRIPASVLRINTNYIHTTKFTFAGYYQYVKVKEYSQYGSNAGNDFLLKIGYHFSDYSSAGYEYFYTNYRYKSDFYYSPRDIESHSVWADFFLEKRDDLKVSFGGKIGTIPGSELLIFEVHTDAIVNVEGSFNLAGRLALGSTSRDNISYKFFSANVSAYIGF